MKKTASLILTVILVFSTFNFAVFADAATTVISRSTELSAAFKNGGNYELSASASIPFMIYKEGITKNLSIKGNGKEMKCSGNGNDSMFFQNEYAVSSFTDVVITGNTKPDVGIWLGSGNMSFTDCAIKNFNITTNRYSALAAANGTKLTLKNTAFSNNNSYDLQINDSATVDIAGSTSLSKVRVSSNFCKINFKSGFSDSFEMNFDNPVAKEIGTVSSDSDISNITVANDNFSLENRDGKLYLKADKEPEIHFDMAQRETLYKGSTGFLYGAAEINVPSVDLLYGLKPDTMVQKAYAGKQHPTGDAIRTSSALLEAGVKDMQIYLQDHYLEWPYDAPYKQVEREVNGEMKTITVVDVDKYQKVVEEILYGMICDKVNQGDEGAFKGSDGNYYKLNGNGKHYSYVLFNEPNDIWFSWNEGLGGKDFEGFKEAWNQIYKAVHKIDPDARCVGPNYSGFEEENYDSFLEYCYNNNCLPEIISWHELGDISLTDFKKHYDKIQNIVDKYYTETEKPELLVNEYARHYDIGSVGGLVKWLAMFEDKDMSGCMAYWAMANTLNEMAADQNSPASTWWVYHWYAQMTGEQCPLVSPEFDKTKFYGVTSYDENNNMGYVLFGGNENENGTETVYLDNINSTDLTNSNDAIGVKIYGVPFSGQLGANYKPEVIFEGNIKAEENSLKIKINNTDEMEAYFAVLTKPEDDETISDASGLEFPYFSYEAENAELLGGATAHSKGVWWDFATSGRMNVGNINNNGDGVCFTVDVSESGYYNASIFYSLQAPYVNPKTLVPQESGQNRGIGKSLPYGMELDGKTLPNITLESTVTWAYKSHCDTRIYLSAGQHKITYKHINGDQGNKGNLQLVAALDKLTLTRETGFENDFEICLDEMSNFKDGDSYRVTAVAPEAGYYTVSADGEFTLKKQCIDYAKDAKSFSKCSVYDVPVGKTVYLAKGANTLFVDGSASILSFEYDSTLTSESSSVINSCDITTHGNSPTLKKNKYANSGYVISELGIGQNPDKNDKAQYNYSTFTLNAPSEGTYNFAIRYSNDEPAPIMQKADGSTYIHPYNIDLVERYAQIIVNGGEPETAYFKNTLSWDTFKTLDVQLELKEGENEIKIYNDNSYQFSNLVNSTAPEIDTITVSKLSGTGEKVSFYARGASTNHDFQDGYPFVTPATTTSNGRIDCELVCLECGYRKQTTTTIYKVSSVSLSKTAYAYDGKEKKPTVTVKDSKGRTIDKRFYSVKYSDNKAIGTAKVKLTFKDHYKGTKTVSFKINPKKTSISKVTALSKGFRIKWSKQSYSGYQIQYAANSSFKSAKTVNVKGNKTTSKSILKLKAKKKYYVRIRTYKTVGGKNYYSDWSVKKAVTTKK